MIFIIKSFRTIVFSFIVISATFRQTPEEGRKTYRPKRCGKDNKDEDNSPKTVNDKNELFELELFDETE